MLYIQITTKFMWHCSLLYIDGAVTGQFDNLQVTALKMTIGILNQKARDREHAWRNLGFVTTYTKEDSEGKRMFADSGHVGNQTMGSDTERKEPDNVPKAKDKAADYHTMLGSLLESLKQLIEEGMVVNIQ